MELVIVNNGVAVTTTLAIAEGTGSDHASVIKLVRNYQSDLEEFGILDFKSENQTGNAGRPTEYASLNEQQSTLLLTYMRNSDIVRNFKKRLVKAFYELASRSNPLSVLSDPAAMRNLLLTYTEKVLTLEHKVDQLAPRAAVADRLTGADGLMSIRDAAKSLKKKEKAFVVWLLENKWLYRDMKGRLRGKADKTPKYVDHKVTPIPTLDDADKVSLQVMITPAGLTRLADIFNVEAELLEAA